MPGTVQLAVFWAQAAAGIAARVPSREGPPPGSINMTALAGASPHGATMEHRALLTRPPNMHHGGPAAATTCSPVAGAHPPTQPRTTRSMQRAPFQRAACFTRSQQCCGMWPRHLSFLTRSKRAGCGQPCFRGARDADSAQRPSAEQSCSLPAQTKEECGKRTKIPGSLHQT
jgi:hypothetical protein